MAFMEKKYCKIFKYEENYKWKINCYGKMTTILV